MRYSVNGEVSPLHVSPRGTRGGNAREVTTATVCDSHAMMQTVNPDSQRIPLLVHVHERGGERGEREYEKFVLATKPYAATTTLADLAAETSVRSGVARLKTARSESR